MNDLCRRFRDALTSGRATWEDYDHVETCNACEMWLQDFMNFRDLQVSLPEETLRAIGHPPCEDFLADLADDARIDRLEKECPCPRCEETRRSMEILKKALSTHLPVSHTLNRRLARISRPSTPLLIQVIQIAAAVLIAAMLTWFITPMGKVRLDTEKGQLVKRASVEVSLAKAYLYKMYGEARGRLAMTLAQNNNPEKKEDDNEVSVSP